MGNLGDEVILQSMVHQLKARLGDVSFTGFSERPDRLRSEHLVNSLRNTTRRLDSARKVFAIARADIFILGGGGILMDYGRGDTNVSKWLEDMELAQRLRVHNVAWGVGVGEVWTDESKQWIAQVLPRADRISVRDQESAMALAGLGVTGASVTCDPALMIPGLEKARSQRALRKTSSGPNILVSLRHWHVTGDWTHDEAVFGKVKSELARVLNHLSEADGASVTFVPFRTEGKDDDDRKVEAEVKDLLHEGGRSVLIDHVPKSDEFLKFAGDADLVIGMRLHSLILGSAVGVPCIGLAYDPKVKNYMSSIGADAWVLPMQEVSFETLGQKADAALSGEYPSSLIERRIAELRESARADIDGAIKLIEEEDHFRQKVGRLSTASALAIRKILARRRRARKTPG